MTNCRPSGSLSTCRGLLAYAEAIAAGRDDLASAVAVFQRGEASISAASTRRSYHQLGCRLVADAAAAESRRPATRRGRATPRYPPHSPLRHPAARPTCCGSSRRALLNAVHRGPGRPRRRIRRDPRRANCWQRTGLSSGSSCARSPQPRDSTRPDRSGTGGQLGRGRRCGPPVRRRVDRRPQWTRRRRRPPTRRAMAEPMKPAPPVSRTRVTTSTVGTRRRLRTRHVIGSVILCLRLVRPARRPAA